MVTEQPSCAGQNGISYRGIRKRKWGRWVAEIRAGKRSGKRLRISLGSYFTPEAAARAYDAALFILRGSSVSTFNFPDSPFNANVWNLIQTGHPSPESIRRAAIDVGLSFDRVPHHHNEHFDVPDEIEVGGEPESVPMAVAQAQKEEDVYETAMEVGSIYDSVPEHYHQHLGVGRVMEGGESVHNGQPETVPIAVGHVEVEEDMYEANDVTYLFPSPERISLEEIIHSR